MIGRRQRVVIWAAAGLVVIWAVAVAGYKISGGFKMTAEKVQAYVDSVDLSKLSGEARARAIQALADKINRLSYEERQRMRTERSGYRWFDQMTEQEKGEFIEATMPTGFKQMITAFEQQPEEKRRRTIDEALKRLREASARGETGRGMRREGGTNRPPPLSPELETKLRTIGLKSFYSQSSAQTKAELAPVLEELQRLVESGRAFRGR
jgi:hypothetical protein